MPTEDSFLINSPLRTSMLRSSSFLAQRMVRESPTAARFFSEVKKIFLTTPIQQNIAFIVIGHVVRDMPVFLKAVAEYGRIAILISKGSYDYQTGQLYKKIRGQLGSTTHHVDGRQFKNNLSVHPDYAVDLIRQHVNDNEHFIILDIGGYYATSVKQLKAFGDRFLGIVEDTQNGHSRYVDEMKRENVSSNVFSVAQSEQKKTEDYNVGKSIVSATDRMLRDLSTKIEEFDAIGVIGFGKIGRSIALHLRDMRVKKLCVYDNNPNIAMQIESSDFRLASRDDIVTKCSLIFCATGNHSLSTRDFKAMSMSDKEKPVYIASVTSSDDELSLQPIIGLKKDNLYLHPDEKKDKVGLSYTAVGKSRSIHLLANGNAINFFYGNNVIGDYIRAVQAAILTATIKLTQGKEQPSAAIKILTMQEEAVLSRLWLKFFAKKEIGTLHNLLVHQSKSICFSRVSLEENFYQTLMQKSHNVINLYGRSTLGKSLFVNQFAQDYKARYDIVWLIQDGQEHEDFPQLARHFNIKTDVTDYAKVLDALAHALSGKSFLIMFDNQKTQRFFKSAMAFINKVLTYSKDNFNSFQHFVFLSREKISGIPHSYEVKALSEEEATRFIRSFKFGARFIEKDFLALFDDYDPLTMLKGLQLCQLKGFSQQTFTWIGKNKQGSMLSTLINLLFTNLSEIQWKEKDFIKTFTFTLSLLEHRDLTRPIWKAIISVYELQSSGLKYLISLLKRHGMLELRQQGESAAFHYMHDLIGNEVRDHLDKQKPEVKKVIWEKALSILEKSFSYNVDIATVESKKDMALVAKHVIAFLQYAKEFIQSEATNPFKLRAGKLCLKLGDFYLIESRSYEKSFEYYQKACDLFKNNDSANWVFSLQAKHGLLVNITMLRRKLQDNHYWQSFGDIDKLVQTLLKHREKIRNIPKYGSLASEISITCNYFYRCKAEDYAADNQDQECIAALETGLNLVEWAVAESTSGKHPEQLEKKRRVKALALHAKGTMTSMLMKVSEAPQKQVLLIDAHYFLYQACKIREGLVSEGPDLARSYYKLALVMKKLFMLRGKVEYLHDARVFCDKAYTLQVRMFYSEHPDLAETKAFRNKLRQLRDGLTLEQKQAYNKHLFEHSERLLTEEDLLREHQLHEAHLHLKTLPHEQPQPDVEHSEPLLRNGDLLRESQSRDILLQRLETEKSSSHERPQRYKHSRPEDEDVLPSAKRRKPNEQTDTETDSEDDSDTLGVDDEPGRSHSPY